MSIYNIKNKKAFTLVELIIVVTILAILATIAFLNFGNYSAEARDSVRMADFNNIQKALELYKIENGEYPKPDEFTEEEKQKNLTEKKYVGLLEGKIGEELGKKLKFGQIPKDPLDKSYYNYSVSEDGKIFLMKLKLETKKEKIFGDIPINCKNLKEKNNFKGNGIYTVFHENIEPREVYCNENFDETFQLGTIGGDMEVILGDNENNQKYASFYEGKFYGGKSTATFVTDEKFSGDRSLKIVGTGNFARSDYIYLDPGKNYKMSGKFKIVKNDKSDTHTSGVLLGLQTYSLIDGKITKIPTGQKIYNPGSETRLARDLHADDKILYFECDQQMYKLWNSRLNSALTVAFNVDETGELKDLPNKNLSTQIGKWLDPVKDKVAGFIQVEGGETWGANKKEIKTCSLRSHFTFGKNYPAGTSIRQHFNGGDTLRIVQGYFTTDKDWGELEGVLNNSRIGKLDNFAKIIVFTNYYPRMENGVILNNNENTTTYADDIKFEVY